MKFGLDNYIISSINNVFDTFPEIEKAYIYGSRAKGNFKDGSDIDLAFVGDKLTHSLICDVSLKLDELSLPYLFDYSILKHIKDDDLLNHINRVGKIFYQQEIHFQKKIPKS